MFEFDRSEAKHLLEEQQDVSQDTHARDDKANTPKFRARFLFQSCDNKRCGYLHECPFCPPSNGDHKACFHDRLRRFGMTVQQAQNQRKDWQNTGARSQRDDDAGWKGRGEKHG